MLSPCEHYERGEVIEAEFQRLKPTIGRFVNVASSQLAFRPDRKKPYGKLRILTVLVRAVLAERRLRFLSFYSCEWSQTCEGCGDRRAPWDLTIFARLSLQLLF